MKSRLSLAFGCLIFGASRLAPAADPATCAGQDVMSLPATPAVIECLLESNRPSAALLLAQRLLAAQPDDAAARALLADALAALNAEPAAFDIPARPDMERKPLWRGLLNAVQHAAWVGIEVGQDSNINSATPLDTIAIPLLNYRSLKLDPLLVQRASPFIGINAGAAVRKPLSGSLSVGARAAASVRLNTAEYAYLPHNYQGEVSLTKRFGDIQLETELGYGQDWVAGYRFVDRLGLAAKISVPLSRLWNMELGASASQNHYPQFNAVKTMQTKGSAGIGHSLTGLSASIHGGEEKAAGDIKDLDRRFAGVALSWRWPLFDRGTILARIGELRSEYLLPSPLFATQRIDTARDFELAYSHRLSDDWLVTPRLIVEQNSSSIPLVAFKRNQALIELRRTF
jgi:hypothetical protein